MGYFNYHAHVAKLLKANSIIGYYYTDKHNQISPALVFVTTDFKHPLMPIREEKWYLYEPFLVKLNEMKRTQV